LLALCETYLPNGKPAPANFRAVADKIMEEAKDYKPWFGIEQEYIISVPKGLTNKHPLGWPEGGFPLKEKKYYCGVGNGAGNGRELVELHEKMCLTAGLNIAGKNAETLPSQWEFQVGVNEGIAASDELWVARYLLARCSEMFGWDVCFEPKPVGGNWSGSGGHINFSTAKMRETGGMREIESMMPKLAAKHREHLEIYGEGNTRRLTGGFETSKIDSFTWGVGNRAASVRIPTMCAANCAGYFEDRRPAANVDPYLATAILVDTTCLASKYGSHLRFGYREFIHKLKKNQALD
jgi:glutamine synthetase